MYDVGQVLYVILEKKRVILPVRVSEQIVRRSASGESITYRVEVPGKEQSIPLSDLSDSHFPTLSDVKAELLSNAEQMIHSMTEKAENIAMEFFQASQEENDIDTNILAPTDDGMKVDLGGGIVGNVDFSALENGA